MPGTVPSVLHAFDHFILASALGEVDGPVALEEKPEAGQCQITCQVACGAILQVINGRADFSKDLTQPLNLLTLPTIFSLISHV